MVRRRVPLFTVAGFEVTIDPSWILLAVLVAWTLSTGFFPAQIQDLPAGSYWVMGILGAAGLFLSIIAHELSHSLVARRSGIPMRGITLFLFGGLAETGEEPRRARDEFFIAVVGPVASVVLGLAFLVAGDLGADAGWPRAVTVVLGYLGVINLVLAAFNLIPAYPLDGGRILRSALWAARKDMAWATRVASRIGQGFGLLLVALGLVRILAGVLVGGFWLVFIGLFLRRAASASLRQTVIRGALGDAPVSRFTRPDPVAVRPETTVAAVLADVVHGGEDRLYPVADDDGQLVGCVTRTRLESVDRDRRGDVQVSELMDGCAREHRVAPGTPAVAALQMMQRHGTDRLLVAEDGRVTGTISRRDLAEHLTRELEGKE